MSVDGPRPDAHFPADPYPGARPPSSFVHEAGLSHPVVADPTVPSGLRLGGRCLDRWLAERDAVPLAGRVPVLAYGSNANPSKISWMRAHRGLAGPVVVLRVRVAGVSAVWAAGLRVVDDQRPATLAAAPGVVERHAVWLAAPDQFAALDAVEGRWADPPRYRLARIATGSVTTECGAVLDRPHAYLATGPPPDGDARGNRRPLLVDGAPVPCSAVGQDAAAGLAGVPAGGDGLDAVTVDGVPDPAAWPSRVFVYGSLMPGQRAWWRIAGHAAPGRAPRPATLPDASVADTGQGYPALTLGGDGVTGFVVELADPVAALRTLDRYEGPQYRRIRVVPDGGAVCWAWLWTAGRAGHRPLPRGWAAR